MSVSYIKLGDVYKDENKFLEAEKMYLNSLEIRKIIIEISNTVLARKDLSYCYNELGDVYKRAGRYIEAMEMYLNHLEIDEKIANETKTDSSYDSLAFAYYNLALLNEDYVKRVYMQKAYNIWNMLSENYPDKPVYVRRRDYVKQFI